MRDNSTETCVHCRCDIGKYEGFPNLLGDGKGTSCIDCYKQITDRMPIPTAEEIRAIWGVK
jgi:hypothetical protein